LSGALWQPYEGLSSVFSVSLYIRAYKHHVFEGMLQAQEPCSAYAYLSGASGRAVESLASIILHKYAKHPSPLETIFREAGHLLK